MAEAKKYKVVGKRKEVGGVNVVRGHVEMTPEQARYHLAVGRLTDPTAPKKANDDSKPADEALVEAE